MYIRNIKTGLQQECHNADVIHMCQKDPKNYEVFESGEKKDEVAQRTKEISEMSASELKALAKEKGIEGASSLTKNELLALLKG